MPKIVFSFLYNIAMMGLALFYLPKLFRKKLHPNYLKNLFGFGLGEIKRKSKGAIWIHAVSLGEMKAVAPLVAKLKGLYPSTPFVFTTATNTGYNEAKKSYPNDALFFLPLDFSFIMKPLVRAIKPKYIFFTETDLWYHLLQASYNERAQNVIVSAKLSERSARNYKWMAKKLFSYAHLICCQNQLYKDRFLALKIPESKLKVTGNLKYDTTYPKRSEEEKEAFKKELGIGQCIVLGSTHAKEEEALLDLMPKEITVVLVPRHPERFDEVAALLKSRGVSFSRLSENRPAPVILVDSMGKLLQFYEIATLAIVCGSYEPIGGHNILEPLYYGTPVLFGPHMHTQFELVDLVLKAEAGLQVPIDSLKGTLETLLNNKIELKRMGDNGKALIASLQGVTERTIQEIHFLHLKPS